MLRFVGCQASSVSVEDMVIAAASLKDGRRPMERLVLPLATIIQKTVDVSRSTFDLLCCAVW